MKVIATGENFLGLEIGAQCIASQYKAKALSAQFKKSGQFVEMHLEQLAKQKFIRARALVRGERGCTEYGLEQKGRVYLHERGLLE